MSLRLAAFLLLAACAGPAASAPDGFAPPQRVEIAGYDGDAMEPALSRDGAVLFFNNRNDPPDETDLHWAERIDDTHYRYRGLLDGVNGPALDAVASISRDGRFCFVSTRSYFETLGTIYCGQGADGRVRNVALQTDASVHTLGRLMFDVETDARGETLIVADGLFRGGAAPAASDLRLARWREGAFHLDPSSDALFAAVNTPDALEYAAALTNDGLTLSFTRLRGAPLFARTELWIAQRAAPDLPFGAPTRIISAEGFVEAGTFSPDGQSLIYHKRENGRFTLWRIGRD